MNLFGIPARRRQWLLAIGDVVVILSAVFAGHVLRFQEATPAPWTILDHYTGASLFFVCSSLLFLYIFDGYNPTLDFRRRFEVLRIGTALILAFLLQLIAYAVFPHGWWGRGVAAATGFSLGLFMLSWRAAFSWLSPRTGYSLRTAIVGAGRSGQLMADVLAGFDGARFVGFISHEKRGNRRHDDSRSDVMPYADEPTNGEVLGPSTELHSLIAGHGVEFVIVAVRGGLGAALTKALLDSKARGVRIENMPSVYKRLTGRVPIQSIGDVSLIFGPEFTGVSGMARTLQRLAALANLVATVYREGSLATRTDAARETRVWLDGKTGSYRDRLDDASGDVMSFKEENNLVDIDANVDAISSRMSALQEGLGEVTTDRVRLEGTLAEHERLLARGETGVLAGMLDDPGLTTMAKERATIVTDAAEVLARYGESHPEHQRVVEHIARVDGLIATEVERIVGEERAEMRSLRRQEAQINEELDEVKEELLGKQHLQEQYSELKLEEDRARRLYASLGERGAEVDLQASSRLNDVRIVDLAVVPTRPASPNKILNLAVALLVGLGGGLGLAFLRERVNDRVRGPNDVEQGLGLSLLGALLSVPEGTGFAERAFYMFDRPRSLAAEGFRGLRAVLLTSSGKDGCRCFVVSSALPGEGKTHTAIGVAAAFAQLGLDVVLVDADLRRPSVHGIFGLDESPGLSDALHDPAGQRGLLQRTRIPRLQVMSCGSPAENPTELLGSPAMAHLIDGLREAFQVVVIDTAPAGLTSDAAVVSQHSDGLLLVVRQGVSERAVVREAVKQLKRVDTPLLGAALNDVPMPRGSVGYGAGYYSDDERSESPPARRAE